MTTTLRSLALRAATFGLGALAWLGASTSVPAHAEDGAQDPREKIRKQMEHIRQLMQENEDAFLVLSTGGKGEPKAVDVTIPPGRSGASGGANGGSDSSAGAGGANGGASGESIAEKIERLLQALERSAGGSQGAASGAIPEEIRRLVEMIPQCSSCSSSMGSPPKQDSGKQNGQQQESSQMRDGRRPEDVEAGREPEEKDGEGRREQGGDQPRTEPGTTGERDAEGGTPPPGREGDSWRVRLPSELRDAAASGQWDRIPPRYRALVERYYRWLQEQKAAQGAGSR